MTTQKKRATSPESGGPTEAFTNSTDSTSRWRQQYRVHPAADVFPMMTDDELAKLGGDIKANGLREPITFADSTDTILDGRNRMEAMERAGILGDLLPVNQQIWPGEPVAYVISQNIHRRHLTKQQQADLIVAAHIAAGRAEAVVAAFDAAAKPRQADEVSKGGRGKVNKMKADAVAAAKAHGISQSTVERAFARAAEIKDEAKEKKTAQQKRKETLEANRKARREAFEARQGPIFGARNASYTAERVKLREMMKGIIEAGYRALAVKHHPDKGGSAADFVLLGRARTILKGNVGR